MKLRAVDLGEGGGGDGFLLEVGEDVRERAVELAFDAALDDFEGTGRDLVLEAGEDSDVLVGDEVGAGADDLAELDEQALAPHGEVVKAAGGAGVVARASFGCVLDGEPLLGEGDGLVTEVDAGCEGGGGEEA